MNPTIHSFDITDYEEVLALWKRCEGVGLSYADAKEAIGTYLERNPEMSFVARAGEKTVGAILGGHDGRRGYIHHLAVDVEWRRKGIARQLVENCLRVLKASGIRKTHIFIFTDNESGIAFWKSVGWTYRNDLRVISRNI
jgi:N-acetylglutamate synthase